MSNPSAPVVALFNRIAPVYDLLNRLISWGQDQRWRREMARRLDLHPDQIILDLSVGTGDQAIALQCLEPRGQVIGLDPARTMMSVYRRKRPQALLTQGQAERLPVPDHSVDRVVCSFGVRNFFDRAAALREIHRALVPGGLWGFLEMSAPRGKIFPKVYAFYFKRIVPLIGALFSLTPSAYVYLKDSVYEFPNYEVMKAEHEQTGFALVYYQAILRGAVGLYVFKKDDH